MMENSSYELWRETVKAEEETKKYQSELKAQQNKYAELLKGDMGKDMKEVLNGNKKITIPLKKRISFKIKCFFENLFNKL